MLNIYTVAFFGHRRIDTPTDVINMLKKEIRKIIDREEYTEFIVGRNGEFDICASSAVTDVQKNYRDDNNALVLILPYPTAEYLKNEKYFCDYYSDIEISYAASSVHPKAAMKIRNKEMVDRSDPIISYIEKEQGGAYDAVKYAMRQNKPVINLFEKL